MRSRVKSCLKNRGARKQKRLKSILGYGVGQLYASLRETLPAGFSWDDYLSGALHIDHKIPLAAFNFKSEDDHDFKRAWSLSNLRLLPAMENLQKKDSLKAAFQPCLL
jgi:hypothetical protein